MRLEALEVTPSSSGGGVYGVIILGRLTGLKPMNPVSKLLSQSQFQFQIQSVALNKILDAEMDESLDEDFECGLDMFTACRDSQG